MPKTYSLCPDEIQKRIVDVMRKHHPLLTQLEVTVQAVFVIEEDEDGDAVQALELHGVPAAAIIKATNLEKRVRGHADAEMTIDLFTWDRLNERSRTALIDHELEHLLPVEDTKEGGWKRDDYGRPKLSMRLHDWTLSGFRSVVERHGESAIEVQELHRFKHEQLPLFPPGVASVL